MDLDINGLVITLLIGLVAGWLAGWITKGSGFGIVGNLIVGVLGALLGYFIAGIIGLGLNTLVARLLVATGGALLLLYLLDIFQRRRR